MSVTGSEIEQWAGLGVAALAFVIGGVVYIQNRFDAVKDYMLDRLETQKTESSTLSEAMRSEHDQKVELVRKELHGRVEMEINAVANEMRQDFNGLGTRINTIHEQLVRREDLARVETQVRDTNIKMDKFGESLTAVLLQLVSAKRIS